jgi:tetratricopeptide (TPR) repeat protein
MSQTQRMKTLPLLSAVAASIALLAGAPLHAADTPEPAPAAAPADPLKRAREAIAAQRWPAAIDELKRVNRTGSADWNNLMGYALRKQATPDLDGAQRYYDAALRIDPKHQGALEYAGELDLMKGKLPEAEQKLARLAQLCSSPCEELDDLKKAVDRYKANGNRYVP